MHVCMPNSKHVCVSIADFNECCVLSADPLSTYPTAKQLSELNCNQWFRLGLQLNLAKDLLESLKESPEPTAATLIAAKVKNIDLNWKHVVESLLLVEEYKVVEIVCSQQGLSVYIMCIFKRSKTQKDRNDHSNHQKLLK